MVRSVTVVDALIGLVGVWVGKPKGRGYISIFIYMDGYYGIEGGARDEMRVYLGARSCRGSSSFSSSSRVVLSRQRGCSVGTSRYPGW